MNKTITTYRRKPTALEVLRQHDPTRTTTIRNKFVRELNKRFRRLRGQIREAVEDLDVFGLKNGPNTNQSQLTVNVQPRQFDFPRSQDKVSGFMEWLHEQVNEGVLEVSDREQIGEAVEDAWTNTFIDDSYKRGVLRADRELTQRGYPIQGIDERGGIQTVVDGPFHADRLGLIHTRVYEDLKGITNDMDTKISRVLSQAMADGDNPRDVAQKLNATISGRGAGDLGITDTLGRFIPPERRARTLARTEMIRSHHVATIQEYRSWEVEGVVVEAELVTAGDDRVCAECQAIATQTGQEPLSLDEAEGLIPVHANCRCIALPVDATDRRQEPIDEAARDLPPEMQEEYAGYRREYDEYFDQFDADDLAALDNVEAYNEELADAIKAKAEQHFPDTVDSLHLWKVDPEMREPLALRQLANDAESNISNIISWRQGRELSETLSAVRTAADSIGTSQYLRLKAMNQSYMAKRGIKKETQYRGVGGEAGQRMRNWFLQEGQRRTTFHVDETSLSGYSSDITTAKAFARLRSNKGLVFSQEFDAKDIVVHRGLLNALSDSYKTWREEFESIIKGAKRTFSKDQIITKR